MCPVSRGPEPAVDRDAAGHEEEEDEHGDEQRLRAAHDEGLGGQADGVDVEAEVEVLRPGRDVAEVEEQGAQGGGRGDDVAREAVDPVPRQPARARRGLGSRSSVPPVVGLGSGPGPSVRSSRARVGLGFWGWRHGELDGDLLLVAERRHELSARLRVVARAVDEAGEAHRGAGVLGDRADEPDQQVAALGGRPEDVADAVGLRGATAAPDDLEDVRGEQRRP